MRVLFLVWRVEVEINSAERTVTVGLAEDDGQLTVERDAMAQMRAAVQIGFYRFLHQPNHRLLAFVRGFVDADDVLLVKLQRFDHLRLEHLDRQVHQHRN